MPAPILLRPLRVLAALLLVAVAAACAPRTIPAEVTRYHATPGGPQPGSFTILPMGEQRGSLEFQAHAEQVATALAARGFTPQPAGGATAPDYAVFLSWGVGDAVTEVRPAHGSTVFGSTGFYGSRAGFGIGMGIPLGPPPSPEVTTRWAKWLRMVLRPGGAPDTGANLFEGQAVITEPGTAIAPVMPYLVEALFDAFPGPNGQTVRVRVPVAP